MPNHQFKLKVSRSDCFLFLVNKFDPCPTTPVAEWSKFQQKTNTDPKLQPIQVRQFQTSHRFYFRLIGRTSTSTIHHRLPARFLR